MKLHPARYIAIVPITLLIGIFYLSGSALMGYVEEINWSSLGDPYLQRVIRFTLWQAFLSASISILLAIPIARALSRQTFPGRQWLIDALGLTFVMPVIVVVFGISAVHGNTGWINQGLSLLGFEQQRYLYGLNGILLAHIFFNLPLACRILLHALNGIPGDSWRLAQQLGFGPGQIWRHIEWPQLKPQLIALFGLIFLLCFASFTAVLALGGGPKATTLEVAIYQSLRFDFDIGRAVLLGLVQISIAAGLLLVLGRYLNMRIQANDSGLQLLRPDRHGRGARWQDGLSFFVFTLLIGPPLLAIIFNSLNANWSFLLSSHVLQATSYSLQLAAASGLLALILSLMLLTTSKYLQQGRNKIWGQLVEHSGNLILVLPSLTLATGLFIWFYSWTDVFNLTPWLVICLHTLMAMPICLQILAGPIKQDHLQYEQLRVSLGIQGFSAWRAVTWPALSPVIGNALAMAMLISLGDIGAIALFGSGERVTLAFLLYQKLGSYQTQDAAVVACWLLLLCVLVFVGLQRLLRNSITMK